MLTSVVVCTCPTGTERKLEMRTAACCSKIRLFAVNGPLLLLAAVFCCLWKHGDAFRVSLPSCYGTPRHGLMTNTQRCRFSPATAAHKPAARFAPVASCQTGRHFILHFRFVANPTGPSDLLTFALQFALFVHSFKTSTVLWQFEYEYMSDD